MKILVAKPNNNTGSGCSLTRWMDGNKTVQWAKG